MKHCAMCSTVRPHAEFGTRRLSPDGLQYHCKICRSRYARQAYQANKENQAITDRFLEMKLRQDALVANLTR